MKFKFERFFQTTSEHVRSSVSERKRSKSNENERPSSRSDERRMRKSERRRRRQMHRSNNFWRMNRERSKRRNWKLRRPARSSKER